MNLRLYCKKTLVKENYSNSDYSQSRVRLMSKVQLYCLFYVTIIIRRMYERLSSLISYMGQYILKQNYRVYCIHTYTLP